AGEAVTAAVVSERERLAALVFRFFPAQVVQTLARLGVPDALGDGELDLDALATRTGADPGALRRLLRAAVGLDLVGVSGSGGYALTPAGQLLRTGVPGSMANLAQLFCGDVVWRSWGELEWSVRTGGVAFERLTGLTSFAHMESEEHTSELQSRENLVCRLLLEKKKPD